MVAYGFDGRSKPFWVNEVDSWSCQGVKEDIGTITKYQYNLTPEWWMQLNHHQDGIVFTLALLVDASSFLLVFAIF